MRPGRYKSQPNALLEHAVKNQHQKGYNQIDSDSHQKHGNQDTSSSRFSHQKQHEDANRLAQHYMSPSHQMHAPPSHQTHAPPSHQMHAPPDHNVQRGNGNQTYTHRPSYSHQNHSNQANINRFPAPEPPRGPMTGPPRGPMAEPPRGPMHPMPSHNQQVFSNPIIPCPQLSPGPNRPGLHVPYPYPPGPHPPEPHNSGPDMSGENVPRPYPPSTITSQQPSTYVPSQQGQVQNTNNPYFNSFVELSPNNSNSTNRPHSNSTNRPQQDINENRSQQNFYSQNGNQVNFNGHQPKCAGRPENQHTPPYMHNQGNDSAPNSNQYQQPFTHYNNGDGVPQSSVFQPTQPGNTRALLHNAQNGAPFQATQNVVRPPFQSSEPQNHNVQNRAPFQAAQNVVRPPFQSPERQNLNQQQFPSSAQTSGFYRPQVHEPRPNGHRPPYQQPYQAARPPLQDGPGYAPPATREVHPNNAGQQNQFNEPQRPSQNYNIPNEAERVEVHNAPATYFSNQRSMVAPPSNYQRMPRIENSQVRPPPVCPPPPNNHGMPPPRLPSDQRMLFQNRPPQFLQHNQNCQPNIRQPNVQQNNPQNYWSGRLPNTSSVRNTRPQFPVNNSQHNSGPQCNVPYGQYPNSQ